MECTNLVITLKKKVECQMHANEKTELLKSTIEKLYTKEGRSFSYIGKLLDIDRKVISKKVKEWNLEEPKHIRHITPSTKKFINRNRTLIIARLNARVPATEIAKELKCDRGLLEKVVFKYDPEIKLAHDEYIKARSVRKNKYKESNLCYDFENLEDEVWKPILGYEDYSVSNMGRVKHYEETYDRYILLTLSPNQENGRLYVSLYRDGKRKAYQVSKLVGYAFVEGRTEEKNTINHKDGDVTNNKSFNLEWVTQGENNKHSYDILHRPVNKDRRYKFHRIIYKNKYEFKTVAAFARFLNKSETQTRRYLNEPEKHDIKLK